MPYTYGTKGMPAAGSAPGLPSRQNAVRGEILFALPGTYLWTVPDGVFSVCVVTVGGGGAAGTGGNDNLNVAFFIAAAAGGGGTAWANDLAVTPGEVITIQVGDAGQTSFFRNTSTCAASGGVSGDYTQSYAVASPVGALGGQVLAGNGFPGGSGGVCRSTSSSGASGGAAGGYSAKGADGVGTAASVPGNAGAGGSASTGSVSYPNVGGTGGLGPFGEGTSGAAPAGGGIGGNGGSGGENGKNGSSSSINSIGLAGRFGAGAGCSVFGSGNSSNTGVGVCGFVRVLWGDGRAFPKTDVGMS